MDQPADLLEAQERLWHPCCWYELDLGTACPAGGPEEGLDSEIATICAPLVRLPGRLLDVFGYSFTWVDIIQPNCGHQWMSGARTEVAHMSDTDFVAGAVWGRVEMLAEALGALAAAGSTALVTGYGD